jgi:arylsulfatase A-like enzyme
MKIIFSILSSTITIVLFAAISPAATPDRPNVVFILADDLGYGDLSCYGATKVSTPKIDSIARDGRRFTDAYSPSSVCTPTRYNLLTGRYAWRTWIQSGTAWAYDPLLIEPERFTLADLFKAQGYQTAVIGKWHLGFGSPDGKGWSDVVGPDFNAELKPGPLEVGFDYFWGFPHVGQRPHILIENHHVLGLSPDDPIRMVADSRPEHRLDYLSRPRIGAARLHVEGGESARYRHEELADRLTDKAVQYIQKRSSDKPFFLYLAHRNVHGPRISATRFDGASDIGEYGDFLVEFDASIGKVLEAIDGKGIRDDTLVIFSSDNGGVVEYQPVDYASIEGHFPNAPLRGQKTGVYEGGIRVPLIVRWPGRIPAGTEDDSLVALTDMLASFAEFFDHTLPADSAEDSVSCWSSLLGSSASRGQRQSLVCDSFTGMMSIRSGHWKLIQGQHGGGAGTQGRTYDQSLPPVQLYDLSNDIREEKNVSTQHPAKVSELTNRLLQIIARPSAKLSSR